MKQNKTTPATVMAIMAFLANDNSVAKASEKFKLSTGTIASMVSGKTHHEVTGLSIDGHNGINYIRENKDLFVSNGKNQKPKTKTDVVETTPTTETQTTPVIVATSSIDISDNMNMIKAEAVTIISKIDSRTAELKAELETLYSQRTHWENVSESFSAM